MIKSKSKQVTNRNKSNMPNHHHNDRYGLRINALNPRQIRNRPQHGLFKDSTYRRRFRNLEHRSEYLQQIVSLFIKPQNQIKHSNTNNLFYLFFLDTRCTT